MVSLMWRVCPSMYTLQECSKGYVVVGKTHPAQGTRKCNGACTGFGT